MIADSIFGICFTSDDLGFTLVSQCNSTVIIIPNPLFHCNKRRQVFFLNRQFQEKNKKICQSFKKKAYIFFKTCYDKIDK
ncbi:hypothetical protein DXC25_07470 [Enterococcus faecalis]|nr:hypothetical protein [Enterococcus faecalis]RGM18668.1 hypothetical protein DXC25_07470 [Enterococcus faecalis]